MIHQTIDINKLTQKQKEFNLSDEMLSKVLGFDDKKLEKIRIIHSVHNADDYLSIMNFFNMGKRKIKIRLNEIKEQEKMKAEEERKRAEEEKKRIARERARKLHEEKKAKEFIEANKKESREATFRSRLKAVKESVEKSKSEVFLRNSKYLIKTAYKAEEREYSTANFVRVPKGTNISVLSDYYYRFSRSYLVEEKSVYVEPETYLRHIDLVCISKACVEHYYERGDVEVFLRVESFPCIKKINKISIKEEI